MTNKELTPAMIMITLQLSAKMQEEVQKGGVHWSWDTSQMTNWRARNCLGSKGQHLSLICIAMIHTKRMIEEQAIRLAEEMRCIKEVYPKGSKSVSGTT